MLSNSLISHIEDLRKCLLKIIIANIILFPICYYYNELVLGFFIEFLSRNHSITLYYFTPMEAFFTGVKIAFFLTLIISFPYNLWQIWKFLAPALYNNEKRVIFAWIGSGSLLFIFGALFSIFGVMPLIINFSYSFTSDMLTPMIGIGSFITLLGSLILGFGLMFQFPLVVVLLIRSEVVDIDFFKKSRAIIIILILVASAILTPPDVVSQLMLGIPSYLMFEAALLIAGKRKN